MIVYNRQLMSPLGHSYSEYRFCTADETKADQIEDNFIFEESF